MKKRFFALMLCLMAAALCVPFFSGCSAEVGYELKVDENGAKYYVASVNGYISALSGELVIPEEYGSGENRAPVKEIAERGFAGTALKKVTIPATVEKIGNAAFSNNSDLEEVVFAEDSSIKEIPWGVFGKCSGLKKVNIPATVKTIDGMSFFECTGLSSLEIPDGVEVIGRRAFEGCNALRDITFPETLLSIGEMAFYNSGLQSVVIPDSVVDVTETVAGENGESEEIFVPGIGAAAFHTCLSLKSAVVGKGVTVIAEGVFGYCSALEEIYLPAGLKEVRGIKMSGGSLFCGHAFHHDGALARIYFGGTAEEWAAVKIDNEPYSFQGAYYDNQYLLNAEKHFQTEYDG